MTEYLTVYRGGRQQRASRPFSPMEEKEINRLMFVSMGNLYYDLHHNQQFPRYQRLVQEAIERKRHHEQRV